MIEKDVRPISFVKLNTKLGLD